MVTSIIIICCSELAGDGDLEVVLHQDLANLEGCQGFRVDLVHSAVESLDLVLGLHVACNGNDAYVLPYHHHGQDSTNHFCKLVPVDKWHRAVGQNQRVT